MKTIIKLLLVGLVSFPIFGCGGSGTKYAIAFYSGADEKLATGILQICDADGKRLGEAGYKLDLVKSGTRSLEVDNFRSVFGENRQGTVIWTKNPHGNPGAQNTFVFRNPNGAMHVEAISGEPAVLEEGASNGVWFFEDGKGHLQGGFFVIYPMDENESCAESKGPPSHFVRRLRAPE